MIILNDDRGTIAIESWQELLEVPGFRSPIDPKETKLVDILGNYNLDSVRCGLSDCRTRHNKGFVVKSSEGVISNIGKDCGKRHFGVDFDTLRKKFYKDRRQAQYRENIREFESRRPTIESEIENIISGDASQINNQLKQLSQLESIRTFLQQISKTGDATVRVTRKATQEEFEDAQAQFGKGERYVQDEIGRLAGTQVLPIGKLRELLIDNLKRPMSEYAALDVESATEYQLQKYSQWIDAVDSTLANARAAIISGRRFLTQSNLKCLVETLDTPEEIKDFRKFWRSLPH